MSSEGDNNTSIPDLEELYNLSGTIVDDPSLLNHNIRKICALLGTQHHEKADQMLGMMILLHSTRMVSTSWTVLLQCLRESLEIQVQLSLIRQFANIVNRIIVSQRSNAFRVFAKEVLNLLDSLDFVVTNHSFLLNFRVILESLGSYGEKHLSQAILDKLLQHIIYCERTEVRRAAALLAAELIANTPHCGTFSNMLDTIEMKSDVLGSCITLDACLPLLIDQAKKLSLNPTLYQTVLHAKTCINKWMLSLLVEDPIRHLIIPVIVSCYEKVKLFDPLWLLPSYDKIFKKVIMTLSQQEIKTILISPLLNLLQFLKPQEEHEIEVIWHLTSHKDPMIRYSSLCCLSTRVHIMKYNLAKDLLTRTINLHEKYMTIKCGYTVSGLLVFITALSLTTYQKDSKKFLKVLRSHFDLTNPLNSIPSVQIEVLYLIEKLPDFCMRSFSFVLQSLLETDSRLRKTAFTVLIKWCEEFVLDSVMFTIPYFRGTDFIEGTFSTRLKFQKKEKSWLYQSQNLVFLILYLLEKLQFEIGNSSRERYQIIQSICEGLLNLTSLTICNYSLSNRLLEETFYRAFIALKDLLLSTETFPFDIYISVISTTFSCLRKCKSENCFDIFVHKELFDYIWSVIYLCCKAIDQVSVPHLHEEHSIYLMRKELSEDFKKMILSSAYSRLTNIRNYRDAHIFHLIEQLTELFIELIHFGNCSTIFIFQMSQLYPYILSCFDILVASNPIVSLKVCRSLFELLFCNNVISDESIQYETETKFDYTGFLSLTVKILTKSLAFDLLFIGDELFKFIKLLIQRDKVIANKKYYLALDTNFSLVRRMFSIVTDKNYYNVVRGVTIVEPILGILELLLSSPYVSLVKEIGGRNECLKVLTIIDETSKELQSDKFKNCRDIVLHMLVFYSENDNEDILQMLTNCSNLFKQKWENSEDFLSEFYKFCEYILLCDSIDSILDLLLQQEESIASAICLCILDPFYIYRLVEFILKTECETFILELVLVIISNIEDDVNVKDAHLVVNESILGLNDDLIAHIVDAFRWGWVECEESLIVVQIITDTRYNFSLRRAFYDAAKRTFLHFPSYFMENSDFLYVALSSFPQVIPTRFTEEIQKIPFLRLFCETIGFRNMNLLNFNLERESIDISSKTKKEEFFTLISGLPFFTSGLSESPTLFLKFLGTKSVTIRELLECIHPKHVESLISTMGEYGLLNLLEFVDIIELTKLCIRGNLTSLHFNSVTIYSLLKRILEILSIESENMELDVYLRYSSMFLLVLVAPDKDHGWDKILNNEDLTDEFIPFKMLLLSIINKCLELSLIDIKSIVRYVVSIFIHSSSNINHGIFESILWLVVKCCIYSVWEVIIGEEICQTYDLSCLKFLCKLNQTVGFPSQLMEEMHARYTPQLLSFGNSRQLDGDEQRFIFWIITSLLLHTIISEERHSKPKTHMSLTDILYQYDDFPLELMSSESTSRIKFIFNDSLFSTYAQIPILSSQRHWNIHTIGYLLPLCGRYTPLKEVSKKISASLIHLYLHVISSVITEALKFPTYCISDVFFSLMTLSAGNIYLLRHSQAYEGTVASNILSILFVWYRDYAASFIDNAYIQCNVLRFHVGLLPYFGMSPLLFDVLDTVACTTIMLSLFTTGDEKINGYMDPISILSKIIKMDIFSYMGALTAMIIMSGASTHKEVEPVAFLLSRRFFDDLESTSWGCLSFNFGILQMIRSACSILSLLPDDHLSIKICEALWNGVLSKTYGRRIQHYTYYTLQCIGHVTTVGQTQWRTLRALLSGKPNYKEQDKPTLILGVELKNNVMEDLKGLNTFIAPIREVPLLFQFSPYALQLQKERNKLFIIETSASLILRSAYSDIQREELDYNSIQVMTYLNTIHDTPSYTNGIALIIVSELLSKIFEQEDALFLALNKFDFTISSKRLLLYEFHKMSERVIKENKQEESRWDVIADATRLLFEASLGKECIELSSWWWLICVMLNSFLGIKEPEFSRLITIILTQPLSIFTEKTLAINITSYLLEIMDCKSRLRFFFRELKELCVDRSSKKLLTNSVTDIITTLLQSIPP
ncbi:uncharacterized protein TM35_000016390 [Trypanosoma theileri]|uniref:Uncharacterized protein n=1 Tax=Trypanosoma theileri TaxID=67003 RepID=A0A1X0PA04_9TRYP|nr:uncharacterized protein TM35_000016390 [Trypanosoma theileri]ORC93762.1 hypothetical protein TM35_000016390 [Trypanosoma theileri]